MNKEEKVIQKRTKREFVEYVLDRIIKETVIDITFWDEVPEVGETFAIISSDLFANGLSKDHLPELISFGSYDRDCTSVVLPHENKEKIKIFLVNCMKNCNGNTIYTMLTTS